MKELGFESLVLSSTDKRALIFKTLPIIQLKFFRIQMKCKNKEEDGKQKSHFAISEWLFSHLTYDEKP